MIRVIDFKGNRIILEGPIKTTVSDRGLVEMWFSAGEQWLPNYYALPVPVFTEWWE